MRTLLFMGMLFISISCKAQELFSMTEPASNMAAGSIGFRVDNSIISTLPSHVELL